MSKINIKIELYDEDTELVIRTMTVKPVVQHNSNFGTTEFRVPNNLGFLVLDEVFEKLEDVKKLSTVQLVTNRLCKECSNKVGEQGETDGDDD